MALELIRNRLRAPWRSRARDTGNGEDAETRTSTPWWEFAAYAVLILTAGGMRLWDLASRALHHDESLHSFYSWQLAEGRGYEHFPMMHGPFQFEANAALFFLVGDTDFTSRLLYALLGTALVGLPFFLRSRMGRVGALLVSGMLVFSPAMLYFSRFARNDILMAVWTLGLVIAMWRYLDEGKNRYLYIASAFLALAFATKETAFILTTIMGTFLVLLLLPQLLRAIRPKVELDQVSPPAAMFGFVTGAWSAYQRGVKLSEVSRPAAFLVLLITLTLPQWSAAVSVFQDTALLRWSNLVLAQETGQIGSPSGGGLLIAAVIVIVMLGLSAYWGSRWNWSAWWRSALIFYVIWVLLFTTFLTNIGGIGSGVWQSLGYWIVQQGEARGAQPWYYYFVITSIYEFLPLVFAVIAAVYYRRRNDLFGHFLVFWAVATLILYTVASEKMPWLLVNVTLPLIVLAGKFLGDLMGSIQWRRLVSGGGWMALLGVPLFLLLLWLLAFYGQGEDEANVLVPLGLAAALLALVALAISLARRTGVRNLVSFGLVPLALVLMVLTVRTGFRASFQNGDVPVEMLVYTQTSPDLTRLLDEIKRGAGDTGQNADIPITIDQTSGFAWPWAWYLRDYTLVSYQTSVGGSLGLAPDTQVMVIHSDNLSQADELSSEGYTKGRRIRHRWWFPEHNYRSLTFEKFLKSFVDRDAWRGAMDYFLNREGVLASLGSEDSYVYFASGFPLDSTTTE